MIMKKCFWLAIGALAVVCLLGVQVVQATTGIELLDSSAILCPKLVVVGLTLHPQRTPVHPTTAMQD